jgi:hypothetical protein
MEANTCSLHLECSGNKTSEGIAVKRVDVVFFDSEKNVFKEGFKVNVEYYLSQYKAAD